MSEPKFTPGPWEVETGVDDIVWVDGPATSVCDLYHTSGQGKLIVKPNAVANAHLIASSPELFEALATLMACAEVRAGNVDPLFSEPLEKARIALAKARGETP
jgi:hypothetical protein